MSQRRDDPFQGQSRRLDTGGCTALPAGVCDYAICRVEDPPASSSHRRREQEFRLNLLAYNVKHPPLDNVDMRRALDMVIDKKATIDAVHFGHAQAGVAPLPPMQWSLGCRAMRGSNFSQWCEGSKA